MAGAGYKLFNTGDVLTAAQVNTYLMQQTVMVFADSTARTTALSGVLAEGMLSYLQDTNTVEVYNGSSWVATVDLSTTQTLTNKTLTSPTINDGKLNLTLNAQTSATYTFVLADNGKLITASNGSALTYSIPTDASVAFPTGAQIHIQQIGAGQVTINAVTPATTTITSTGATAASPKLRAQYSAATCIKTGTNTWTVVGDIA